MGEPNETELSALQRFICNIITGATIVLLGVFLLLAGSGAIGLSLSDVVLPSVLLALGLIFLATAIVQKNSVSMWIAFYFIVPSLVIFLVGYVERLSYANLYPFFIAIPAIASLFTMTLSTEYRIHLRIIAFFGTLAALLSLQSFGIASWQVIIPSLVILLGIIILLFALRTKT